MGREGSSPLLPVTAPSLVMTRANFHERALAPPSLGADATPRQHTGDTPSSSCDALAHGRPIAHLRQQLGFENQVGLLFAALHVDVDSFRPSIYEIETRQPVRCLSDDRRNR